MITFLRYTDKVSDRKGRLTACACCRLVWPLLRKASRRVVELAEQLAEGTVNEEQLAAAIRTAIEAVCTAGVAGEIAADMAYKSALNDGWYAANWTVGNGSEVAREVALLRDIFGNPFRPPPAIDPDWLTWNEGIVKRLAEAAYEERALPSGHLDVARLAVLTDALTDAGCSDTELLDHLRSAGPHVRGCWAIDLLAAKERGTP
jgi:hypothetical protein